MKPFHRFCIKYHLEKGESYPPELVEVHRLINRRLERLNQGVHGWSRTLDTRDRPELLIKWYITPERWPSLYFTGPYSPGSEYGVWTAVFDDYIPGRRGEYVFDRPGVSFFDVAAPDFYKRLGEAIRATGTAF